MPASVNQVSRTRGPRLRGDATGFLINGKSVEGFPDDERLSLDDRALLAAWAARYTPEELTEGQRALLKHRPTGLSQADRELLAAAMRDAEEDLQRVNTFGLYERIHENEREKLRALDYPVGIRELAKATGATERQLRDWENLGLLPSYRIRGQRRFFSAAAFHAAALRQLDRRQVAILGLLLRGGEPASDFLPLVGAAIGVMARRLTGEPARELGRAAGVLGKYGREARNAILEPVRRVEVAIPEPRAAVRRARATQGVLHASRSGKEWALKERPSGRILAKRRTQKDILREAERRAGPDVKVKFKGTTGSVRVLSPSSGSRSRRSRRARSSRSAHAPARKTKT